MSENRKDRIEDEVSMDDFIATVGVKKDEHICDIPLDMIKGIDCDKKTDEIIEDWRYWCEKY
jgi:hypothetical protein